MKIKKIQWYNGENQSLRQALSSGVEFSFVSPDDKQVSPFAFCKDYLQDAVQGYIHHKRKTIYGFTYDPKKHPEISLKKTRLLVTNSRDVNFGTKVACCLDFLHQIETDLKISRTRIHLCESPPRQYIRCGVWLFEGSNRWIKSPPMLSMYTLLIRLGFGNVIGKPYREFLSEIISGKKDAYQSIDAMRLREAEKGIMRILTVGDKKIFDSKIEKNYPEKLKTTTMHNTCGIIGFSEGKNAKKHMPSWYKETV
jgi:hypothetical protein